MLRPVGWFLIAGLLGGGCSGNNSATPDGGTKGDGKAMIADLGLALDGPGACGPSTYPCAPYGTRNDEVASNETFLAFADPGGFCKTHPDEKMDATTVRQMGFHSWYQWDSKCPTKKAKLAWFMVSAGWCGPCWKEIQAASDQYRAGAIDDRVSIVEIVFEDDQHKPATAEWTKNLWIPKFNIPFPVLIDPAFKMGKYFNKEAVPFNMLVDLSTMKIYYQQTGGDFKTIGEKIQAFLNK
ncbi:MAG: hypothetical protein IT371_11455 [Deltaproteobacteria bacterium]|nr:hypothetical protein [Deltaproteobacteria bacterium]